MNDWRLACLVGLCALVLALGGLTFYLLAIGR